jgi:hypothetical protein
VLSESLDAQNLFDVVLYALVLHIHIHNPEWMQIQRISTEALDSTIGHPLMCHVAGGR